MRSVKWGPRNVKWSPRNGVEGKWSQVPGRNGAAAGPQPQMGPARGGNGAGGEWSQVPGGNGASTQRLAVEMEPGGNGARCRGGMGPPLARSHKWGQRTGGRRGEGGEGALVFAGAAHAAPFR
jgi:hypothetical protein